MKKILALAPALLLALASCNNNPATATTAATGDNATETVVSNQIAYVNLDTLLSRYNMFLDMSSALEAKAGKAETDLTNRARSFERSVADFQEKIDKGLVTRAQAAELQEKLQRQEQSLMQQQEQVRMELSEENTVMMNNLFHNINKYLEELNSDYRYGVILSTSGGTPILNADPRLDITGIVLDGLNDAYAKEKK